MTDPRRYDLIIAGAGCAGLSLLVRLIQSEKFAHKRILLVDKDEKKKNDRTWCFWETTPDIFEPVVHHRWNKAWFHGENYSGLLDLQPYQYKLVRGIDFYQYCFDLIRRQPNIDILFGEISEMVSNDTGTSLLINGEKYSADHIFNSILFTKPELKKKEYYLLQHFKGWVIETEQPVFNPEEPTLMDLTIDQQDSTTFVYIMPFSSTQALVEYTLFSENLIPAEEYDRGLRSYIEEYTRGKPYKVIEEEFGVIPMTNHRFPVQQNRIIHIGTAGGQTKASSGYTFRFIQKQTAAITKAMVENDHPVILPSSGKKRFDFYDSTLLYILKNKKVSGKRIFTDLFKKNEPQRVLRFLDNESSLAEELKIISSLPTGPFLAAGLKQL